MTPGELFKEFVAGFPARKFSSGLLIAFIDFYAELGIPRPDAKTLGDVLKLFPRQTTTAAGKRANTLIVARPDGSTLSLRPFYNNVERFFRAEQKRFDYPSCAPHATQAWADYQNWLDALASSTSEDLAKLRKMIVDYVLETLKSQAFDPSTVIVEAPMFRLLLEDFEMASPKGEPTGAAFQGMVFGFLRADNPHLQIEIDKVRTGSKRLQRVGDIDGWEGERLAISAEVKQTTLKSSDVADLAGFANETGRRGTLGLIVTLGFDEGVREKISELGARPLDLDDLTKIVELWDPLKQRTAVASFVYYARHVEKNSILADRLDKFIRESAAKNATIGAKPKTG